jgi:2-polyprenyl-6-hydroxyphenyl methylase/3-demethylubiquinone-9 3-methyltransferase
MKAASAPPAPAGPPVPRTGGSPAASARGDRSVINNAWYDGLGSGWHEAWDHPIALLRAEGALKNPWVRDRVRAAAPGRPARVLDLGCGAGFLAEELAAAGHRAIGLDASFGSLKAARSAAARSERPPADAMPGPAGRAPDAAPDPVRTAGARGPVAPSYLAADAYRLPFPDSVFDAVCALDFLEHVTAPARVVAEAARVLRPGGRFFFHTFNRNPLAWLVVIKGVEWFVRHTPPRMHVLPLFLKPAELEAHCGRAGLRVEEMRGMGPSLGPPFWKLLATRRVPRDFRFRFTRSLALGYLGSALKPGSP